MLPEKALMILRTIIEDCEINLHRPLAAMIINNKNEILSIGYSLKKTHPFQKRFGKNDKAIYLHAEIDAIHKALKRNTLETLQRSTIFIVRLKKFEVSKRKFITIYGLAKPCQGCMAAIKEFGIKRIYHTCNEDCFKYPNYDEILLS